MRLLPPLPASTWDFEIDPSPAGSGESGLVVSRPDFPGLFILNSSARFIWAGLRLGGPQNLLAERFAKNFGIPFSQASSDLASTLDAWSHNLLAPSQATQSVASPPPLPSRSSFPFSCGYVLNSKHFLLLASDPDFSHEIQPRLAHLAASSPTPDFTFHVFRQDDLFWVFRGEASLCAEPLVSTARSILLEEIARLAYGVNWLAILHAAACSNGRQCVILPAPTNSGKSTLTAALMHSGLQILSDDSAPLDRHSRQIFPLPFALMLRSGSWPLLDPFSPELSALPIHSRFGDPVRFLPPPAIHAQPVPAKCLCFVQFQPGAPPRLQSLSPFESLCALQKSGFWVPHTRPSIAAFLAWYQSLPAYQLTFSDLYQAVPLVHSLLA
jgi:hypothetical protein